MTILLGLALPRRAGLASGHIRLHWEQPWGNHEEHCAVHCAMLWDELCRAGCMHFYPVQFGSLLRAGRIVAAGYMMDGCQVRSQGWSPWPDLAMCCKVQANVDRCVEMQAKGEQSVLEVLAWSVTMQ